MSQTQYLYNDSEENLLSTLTELFEGTESVDCAIAFLTLKGWSALRPIITEWVSKPTSKQLRFLVREDKSFPDMRAVEEILKLRKTTIRLFPGESFHLKQWLFYYTDKVKILTGSSNFTEQGLKHNIEANILTETGLNSPDLKIIQNQFNKYWNKGKRLGEKNMEIATGLSIKLQKVTHDEIVWIDNLFEQNPGVFNYRIQGINVGGQMRLSDVFAQIITIDFSGLDNGTLQVITTLKDKFQSQEENKQSS